MIKNYEDARNELMIFKTYLENTWDGQGEQFDWADNTNSCSVKWKDSSQDGTDYIVTFFEYGDTTVFYIGMGAAGLKYNQQVKMIEMLSEFKGVDRSGM